MLIQVKNKGVSPFYGGRNTTKRRLADEDQRRLQVGIAKVALEAKVLGHPAMDAGGRPLKYANGYAQGYSASALERTIRTHSRPTVVVGSFQATGSRRTPWPWEDKHDERDL